MKEKKKLLFVIPTLRIGGAVKALVTLLKALDPKRFDVDLFLFERGGELEGDVPEWVTILPENKITRAMTLEIRYYFRDLLRERRFAAASRRLGITFRAALRSKLHKKPRFSWTTVSRHVDPLPDRYDTAIGFLEGVTDFFVLDKVEADKKIGWIHTDFSKRVILPEDISYYCRFDKIATISPACKAAFETAVPGTCGRVFVVENLVLPEDVRARAEEPIPIAWDKNVQHLITLGRLETVKGIDLAIRASRILVDKDIPIQWHVFGEGSKKEMLEQMIDELCLQDCFILEGTTPNPLPFLKAADVFVQPSRQEGKSIALDEAKLLGKAIVATNYLSVEDQIVNNETGVITGMEPKQIADGIEKVLSDPALRCRLESNCRQLESPHSQILEKFYGLLDES